MSELPDGIPPGEVPVPVDSASGIILRRAEDGEWDVLLGLRSRRSRFMPGHLVFPGGALEQADRPGEAGALSRCVAREVREEAGLDIPPQAWIDAGARTTPPMFPLRFRNRFFVAVLPRDAGEPVPAPAEIEELRFARPEVVLREWSEGIHRVPPPSLPILRSIARTNAEPDEMAAAITRANELEHRLPRIEFSPDVWALPLRTATLPPATHTNVWMPGGETFVVVDPGSTESEEIDRLEGVIERRRSMGRQPLAVLLTHHHRDHAGGAVELTRRLVVPLRAHPSVLDGIPRTGDVPALEPIDQGDSIDLGGMTLDPYFTPGHAPGHLCFLLREARLLIAGDLISGLSTILIDPDGGDMERYLGSLRLARGLDCRMLLPGHGPPLPARALDRLIAHREERERRVLEQISAPGTDLSRIAAGAYDDAPDVPPALTERQALAQLIHLERRGRVRRDDDRGRSWSPARRSES